jgi:ribosomal protein L7/L12
MNPSHAAPAGSEREWSRVLSQLRANGFSVIESIKVTRAVLDVSLGEAKRLVHTSPAWADARLSFDTLHEAAEVAATEAGSA